MKFWLLFISGVISTQSVRAEFSDPMRPPAYALEKFRLQKMKSPAVIIKKPLKVQKKETWVLSSILYSNSRQHAIINNQLVKKGDMIKGARLIRLKPDSVRLIAKGKIIDLKIYNAGAGFKLIKKSLNEKKI